MRKAYRVLNKAPASHTSDDASSLVSDDFSISNLDESTWHTSDLGQNGSHIATSDCFSLTFAFSYPLPQTVCSCLSPSSFGGPVGHCRRFIRPLCSLSPSFGGHVWAFWSSVTPSLVLHSLHLSVGLGGGIHLPLACVFHFTPVLSLPPARRVKDFGSHPCVSPIPSLLVSSPVLHSGWAEMEDLALVCLSYYSR